MISAPGEPPGSRVSTTSMPSAVSRSARSLVWVDLPAPSPPSKVMKRPRILRLDPPKGVGHRRGTDSSLTRKPHQARAGKYFPWQLHRPFVAGLQAPAYRPAELPAFRPGGHARPAPGSAPYT